jgi:hypothetical protein
MVMRAVARRCAGPGGGGYRDCNSVVKSEGRGYGALGVLLLEQLAHLSQTHSQTTAVLHR